MTRSEFVYLYRGGQAGRSSVKREDMMQKWMSWMKQLTEKGCIKQPGHPLEQKGKLVRGRQRTVIQGPFGEAKEVVGGYTLIEAHDLDDAVEISKGCPIFDVDGAVEGRPVMNMKV